MAVATIMKPKRRGWLRPVFWLTVLPTVAMACLLIFPLPKAAVIKIVDWSADWMLADQGTSDTVLARYGMKFVGLLVQNGLAAHIVDANPVALTQSDVDKVAFRLFTLKRKSIVQSELMHTIPNGPALLTGLGWCDNINGAAALLLSHDFERSEIIGVYNPTRGSGHSFGRIWSDQYQDWLYFDVWPHEVVIFTDSDDAPARYLARLHPVSARSELDEDVALIDWFHNNASTGFVHNQLQPTLLGYLAKRIGNLLDHGDTAPAGYSQILAENLKSANFPKFDYNYPTKTVASKIYLSARINLIFGQEEKAEIEFRKISKLEKGETSIFGKASELFLTRLLEQKRGKESLADLAEKRD